MSRQGGRRVTVAGAGGFIGHHLVKRLKEDGFWVRGVDIKKPAFSRSPADEFVVTDLREPANCHLAVKGVEDVYQLAADMGGMGFISRANYEVLQNNALINLNMSRAAAEMGILRYFFSSSVCVYRDMHPGEPRLTEEDAIPANPDNEYGWEKLYAERVAMASGQRYGMKVRIGRFENTYGPEGTWTGGREKAPAAICRKIAETDDGGSVEIWGNGSALRNYTYIDDLVEGICLLMESTLEGPVNIGGDEHVTVDELVDTVIKVSGKQVKKKYVEGPVGVSSRNFSKDQIKSLGWKAKIDLKEGVGRTYPWIEAQVAQARKAAVQPEDGTGLPEQARR